MVIQRLTGQPLQKALYVRLNSILSVSVFDSVPDGQLMPYVVIGNDTSVTSNTKTNGGQEVTVTLHVWSEYQGNKEAQDLMDTISQSLTTTTLDLSVDNFKVLQSSLDFTQILQNIDGMMRQGVLRFRFLIEDII